MKALIVAVVAIAASIVPCSAQSVASSRLHSVTSPPRHAGVFHVATGTWTRHASQATLGADVIYDNTCSTGYFAAFSGDTFIDEGRVPSPSSPTTSTSRPGCSAQYTIDGFQ